MISITLPETNTLPLKIGHPKQMPLTIDFQGADCEFHGVYIKKDLRTTWRTIREPWTRHLEMPKLTQTPVLKIGSHQHQHHRKQYHNTLTIICWKIASSSIIHHPPLDPTTCTGISSFYTPPRMPVTNEGVGCGFPTENGTILVILASWMVG